MSDPALIIWNRLEGKPRSQNLEKALRAEIRDPLWMLCRQWQFGEFQGEDAAAPVCSRIRYKRQFLSAIETPAGKQLEFGTHKPLNPLVEAMPFELNLHLRIEIGRHWLRMLRRLLPEAEREPVLEAFMACEPLHFNAPAAGDLQAQFDRAEELSNTPLQEMLLLTSRRRVIDGSGLLDLIVHKKACGVPLIDQTLQKFGGRLLDWIERVYHFSLTGNTAWRENYLEYQFDIRSDEDQVDHFRLHAEEYSGRNIDWYQFDYEHEKREGVAGDRPEFEEIVQIPVQVNYPGMPKTRWWEMEDARVNLGNIKTTTDNPARLLFTQFNLVYGNDWFMLPMEAELGTVISIESIVVVDNFGLQTRINPTPAHSRGNWSFFNFFDREAKISEENWFYYPATASDIMQGDPIEQVNFIRDEMANMVWGIEKIVSDGISKGMPGRERAGRLASYLQSLEQDTASESLANEAEYTYRLSSSVPEHWIPFVPVKIGKEVENRQIQLQRAALPRLVKGFEPRRIRPATTLLNQGTAPGEKWPFLIHEEEIPRAGVLLNGRWKRTRWLKGKTLVWYAMEKSIGRGEGSSKLKFDFLTSLKQ